jgi:hypothetical protein
VRRCNAELKLLLGIPSAGSPSAPFLDSLVKIELPANLEHLERAIVTGNYIPAQRDLIVEKAIDAGADILVMCDDDMVLPPDAIASLCAVLEADPSAALTGALYYSRDGFRPMAVDQWNEEDTRTAVIPAFDRDPVAVDGIGFGCVALRVAALRELMPPYFTAHVFIERGLGRVRICNEDYLFCARLRRAGWRVLLVPSVRCGHYDRQSKTVVPATLEPPEITSRARMAVLIDGRLALIEASQSPGSTSEVHVRANLEYVLVP